MVLLMGNEKKWYYLSHKLTDTSSTDTDVRYKLLLQKYRCLR